MDYSHLPPTLLKEIKTQGIKKKLEEMKVNLLENIEKTYDQKLEALVNDLTYLDQNSTSTYKKNGLGYTKEYIARPSLLSELLNVDHIRTIYNIFIAILIILFFNTIITDLCDQNNSTLGFDLIKSSFGNLTMVVTTWVVMFSSTTIILYPLFQLWASSRDGGPLGKRDIPWLCAYVIYQVVFLFIPPYTIISHQLPVSSSFIVMTEQVRLMMKSHAFVRENIPKVARKKAESKDKDDETEMNADFTTFLYFLFAPTLIYRDKYPRNQGAIRWRYVVTNLLQVVGSVFYMYFIFEKFLIPHFKHFDRHSTTPKHLLISIFSSVLPATLALFITFFAILHSWLNAFAEMLQFADRLFYKDWWNSSSFSTYYRTWNVVVHDWLYAYVYQDVSKLIGNGNRTVPMLVVFLLSAVMHEYILSFAFGFFYPVLFFMFAGAGFGFIFLPRKSHSTGNIFLWIALFIGTGMLMCFYSMEWYARKRCPPTLDSSLDLYVPRSWTCDYDRISPSPSSSSSSSSSPSSSSTSFSSSQPIHEHMEL